LLITTLYSLKSNLFKDEIQINPLLEFIEKQIKEINNLRKDELLEYLKSLNRYPFEFNYRIENNIIKFDLDIEKIDIDEKNFQTISEYIEKEELFGSKNYQDKYEEQKKYISKLENKLKKYKKIENQFLTTSSLTNSKDIWKEATRIISNLEARLYMMVAFYEEDYAFERLLKTVINEKKPEVKILYRFGEKDNLDFIRNLKKEIEDEINFKVKPYHKNNLKKKQIKYIGNLHSKMILTNNYLMVGSANLTPLSKRKNEESAILTNDEELIKKATNHFLEIWRCFSEKEL